MRRAIVARNLTVLLLAVLGSLAPSAAHAQWGGVSFTPSSGSWIAGTPVSVTIEFCGNPEQYYLSHWITFNGQQVTGSFSQASGTDPNCVFQQFWSGSVTLVQGTNTLAAGFTAYYSDGGYMYWETPYSGQVTFTGTTPPPPDTPTLEDYGRCALSCFAATYALSTVPYFSLDTPRNVTLVYNGDRVDPKPFIHVDYTVTGTPSYVQLRARKVSDQTFITFLNGETALRFQGTAGTRRLGGQFNAASNGMGTTGAYQVEILVGQMVGGNFQEQVVATRRVIVVNENNSPIARGWTLAGIQRLYPIGGGALITESDGSAVYFSGNGAQYVRPAGEFSTLSASGGTWTRVYPDSTTATFDNAGRMTQIRDRWNNTTTISYDGSSRVSVITDPQGDFQIFTYGPNGLGSIAALSRTTMFTVQTNRTLTAMTDPDNFGTQFSYDASLRLRTVTDRAGATTTLGYHAASGKLDSITAPLVPIYGAGNQAPRTLLSPWQLLGVPYVPTAANYFATVASSQVQGAATDPGGHTTSFTVNAAGQPLVTTPPLGPATTVTYTAQGLAAVVVQPTGGIDTTLFNADGLPTYARPAGRAATSIYYTAGRWGQPDSAKTAGQTPVHNSIGANGRIDRVRIGTDTTFYAYDSRGRVTTRTDPGHHSTTTAYAGMRGNRSIVTTPGARVTRYYQDALGRDTSVQGPAAPRQRVIYDMLNRVTAQYDSAGATPTLTWWGRLRVDSLVDPAGNKHRFGYNALGWLMRRTDPAGRWDSTRYNLDGLAMSWTNRRNQTMTFAYDALHRRTSKSGAGTQTESWSYSTDGRVVTATSPVSVETVRIGTSRSTDSVSTVMAGLTFTQHYRYDPLGRLDSAWAVGPNTLARGYNYSPTGGLETIVLGGMVVGLELKDDVPIGTTLPSGASVERSYNGLHALGMANAAPGATSSFANAVVTGATYDSAGRIEREIRNVEGTGLGYDWQATGYTYDRLGRLRAESIMVNNVPPASCDGGAIVDEYGNSCLSGYDWVATSGTTYSYDVLGNRTDHGGAYTTGNRLTNFDGCSFTHDYDGNTATRKCGTDSTTFFWSAESRLDSIRVNKSGGVLVRFGYRYDAMGRLVRRDSAGVARRHYLWDGDNLLAELDGSATTKVAEYSYYGMDRLHALVQGTTPYYAHQDVRGNSLALTDNTVAYRRYWYSAWGTLTSSGDAPPFNGADRARWKGALSFESDAGLYYMRNRWYEPRTGRFISEDPLGLEAGLNPYLFTHGDPVNRRDPTGLSDMGCAPGYEAWTVAITMDDGTRYEVTVCVQSGGSGFKQATSAGTEWAKRGTEAQLLGALSSKAGMCNYRNDVLALICVFAIQTRGAWNRLTDLRPPPIIDDRGLETLEPLNQTPRLRNRGPGTMSVWHMLRNLRPSATFMILPPGGTCRVLPEACRPSGT